MASQVACIGALLSLGVAAVAATRSTAFQQHGATPVTAEHPTRLACDLAYSIAAKSPGVSIQRSTGVFADEVLEHPARGCRLAIAGSFEHAPPGGDAVNRLRDGFTAQGWREMLAYSADGKDGTAFAFRKTEVLCLFRGTWNGGADGDPSTPRGQTYRVSVLCISSVAPE